MYWSGHSYLCLGEFGEIGDSEEGLADPVQKGEAIVSNDFILDHDQSPTPIIAIAAISNFLFRHKSFLLLFPFYAVLCHLVLATPSPLATIHSPLFSGNPNTINLHVLMVH